MQITFRSSVKLKCSLSDTQQEPFQDWRAKIRGLK